MIQCICTDGRQNDEHCFVQRGEEVPSIFESLAWIWDPIEPKSIAVVSGTKIRVVSCRGHWTGPNLVRTKLGGWSLWRILVVDDYVPVSVIRCHRVRQLDEPTTIVLHAYAPPLIRLRSFFFSWIKS